MSPRRALVACALVVLAASPAAGQTPAPAAQAPAQRPATAADDREFLIGGAFTGPASMGSASAVLFGATGAPSVTLFRTENRAALGIGLETGFGFRLRPSIWAEVVGAWTRVNLSTRITDDFEDAPDETLSAPVHRFAVEGAALWYFKSRGKTAWFLRGSGGWMREAAGGGTLTDSGVIASAGLGVRHWWRTGTRPNAKRVGLRAEFRGVFQTGGLSLGSRSVRFGPAGVVNLVIGY